MRLSLRVRLRVRRVHKAKNHLTAAISPSSPCATVSYPWQAVLAPVLPFLT